MIMNLKSTKSFENKLSNTDLIFYSLGYGYTFNKICFCLDNISSELEIISELYNNITDKDDLTRYIVSISRISDAVGAIYIFTNYTRDTNNRIQYEEVYNSKEIFKNCYKIRFFKDIYDEIPTDEEFFSFISEIIRNENDENYEFDIEDNKMVVIDPKNHKLIVPISLLNRFLKKTYERIEPNIDKFMLRQEEMLKEWKNFRINRKLRAIDKINIINKECEQRGIGILRLEEVEDYLNINIKQEEYKDIQAKYKQILTDIIDPLCDLYEKCDFKTMTILLKDKVNASLEDKDIKAHYHDLYYILMDEDIDEVRRNIAIKKAKNIFNYFDVPFNDELTDKEIGFLVSALTCFYKNKEKEEK